ncbi:MAG TPA: hypothetical protein VK416_09260, partial [Thermoanaerobaculia bacterium]|nr:hypothetical protein [Thermoanaerobaculia bacterium]
MFKRMVRTALMATLATIVTAPLFAQLPPPPPLPGLEIRIGRQAPPRIRRERRTARPDRNSVWIQGFWHWESDN